MRHPKVLAKRGIDYVLRTVLRGYHRDYYSDRWHPHYELRREALAETVQYIKAEMTDAMVMDDGFGVLTYASRHAPDEGLVLEFGVRTGTTTNHLARLWPETTVYGFDSFQGLPEDWTGWTSVEGEFGGEGIPTVADNVELVVGWFDETLPGFVRDHRAQVALVHIDSDLYSSARTILSNLAPQIAVGTVIVFNEYFNYPNWKEHEFKAFQEFCRDHSVEYDYLCWGLYEVAVRIRFIAAASGDSPDETPPPGPEATSG
ncbi:MAG: class I SAM-dependent methyltransferase [Acidimicrobiales bacterium]